MPHWSGRLGVVCAVLTFLGFGLLAAVQRPPFLTTDEAAHLGYAHEISRGRLPEITSEPVVPATAVQWRTERTSAPDDRYHAIWVANHPPMSYLAVAPLMWWSDVTGRPDGGLLFMRIANLAAAAIGVGLTYLLGRELSGGIRTVGVLAASLVALLPHGHGVFSQGLTDGMAFAAVTFVAWAGVICLQRGVNSRRLTLLAVATAVAAGSRIMALAVAVVVVGAVACDQLRAGPADPWRRVRACATVVVVGLLPATVLWGWFYVRNSVLYGDAAGSEFLLHRFHRAPRGSWFELLTWGHLWADRYRAFLWSDPPVDDVPAPLVATAGVAVALLGLVVVAITGRSAGRLPAAPAGQVSRRSLALVIVVAGMVALLAAQHFAGGGGRYARYLLPSVGALACLVALGTFRLSTRILPLSAVVLLGIQAFANLPVDVDPAGIRRPRDDGPMPALLEVLPATPSTRLASALLITVGLLGLGTALVSATIPRHLPRRCPSAQPLTGASGDAAISSPVRLVSRRQAWGPFVRDGSTEAQLDRLGNGGASVEVTELGVDRFP
jgi:hypothetical protein